MILLPPRLAIGLSAGIVGALLPSHALPALVLCVMLAILDSLRRGCPFCLHVSVLPCHRLPYRPSSEEEAPLPRFCMFALRLCADSVSMTFLKKKTCAKSARAR